MNGIFKKVMWVGKATTFGVGLTVSLALVFGVATVALAAVPGDPFKLGKINTINKLSSLVGSASTALLRIDNNGTGPALDLQVEPGADPLTLNSNEEVDNLRAANATQADSSDDADKLDGQDSSAFATKNSEAWHEVGASGEPAFAQPFGINGWANYGDGYNTVGFYKDSVGNVHLKGLFIWTHTTSLGYLPCDGPPLFTLPAGYRPQAKELQGTHKKPDAAGRIDILPSGEVRACDSNVNQGKWFSLDGTNFRAAQ